MEEIAIVSDCTPHTTISDTHDHHSSTASSCTGSFDESDSTSLDDFDTDDLCADYFDTEYAELDMTVLWDDEDWDDEENRRLDPLPESEAKWLDLADAYDASRPHSGPKQ